ncbi:hypothetical protein BCV69DRAFT_252553, partial [Microstroma glucosiphilum]
MYQPGVPLGYIYARGTPYEKKYFSKKLGFCCLFLAPPIIIVALALVMVPILYGIGNHALHTSVLHVYGANLTNIGNSSFPLSIQGQVKKTGIFPAHLYFREPIQVFWNTAPPNMREVQLGTMSLDYIGVAAGHGSINQATTFEITDEEAFGEFAQWLISEPQFTWQLRCPNVHVEAFSILPTFKNLVFTKNVVIDGINGFNDVKVLNFQLPGDDPAGGITTQVLTQLNNPSPFGIQLGDLQLALYYQNMFLGNVFASDVNITTGLNTILIAGQLVPHLDNSTELDLLGQLFTGYINGIAVPVVAKGVATTLTNGQTVTWLQTGITALTVNVPLQSPTGPILPITGIAIDYLSLVYSEETPYNPVAFSPALLGNISLPFGFSLSILELQNTITILYDGALVGSFVAPYAASNTVLQAITAGETVGQVMITLPPTSLLLPNTTDAAREELIVFQNAFTYQGAAAFNLEGSARALTDTPLGRVLLDGIPFAVGTGLNGLAGLLEYPTVINSVDVVGGAPDAISLAVGTTIVNPSNLNLTLGDVTLNLINQVPLGNVTLPNLNLAIGEVTVAATSFFDPNRAPEGLEVLNRFISGQYTYLNISGFADSSPIQPLSETLSGIRLNTTLPALTVNLVQSANLTVLPTTGTADSVADSIVFIKNPFTAGLTITNIKANATSKGIYIANIDQSLNYVVGGHATAQSPTIPLTLNLYPPDIFGLLRALVVQSGQDPSYLDGVVGLGGYSYSPTTAANGNTPTIARRDLFPAQRLAEDETLRRRGLEGEDDVELAKRDNLYTGFTLPPYVLKAFSVATLDLLIESEVNIGEYPTTITFSQSDVALGTDDTLDILLPVLALPIVQKIVDNAILNIERVTILNPQQNTFTVSLQGTITNSGPFDAVISFPTGLAIYWEGQLLVQTAFPDVSLTGDTGASINVMLEATVPDVDYLTTFTKYLLTQPSFVWSIQGTGLSVAALGITVPNITITKDVALTAFNGLQGMVIINSFDLPSNSPAGGITLTAISTINSPSQVGVQLTRFGTNIVRNGTTIGPAAATSEFILEALSVTVLPLAGNLVEQTDANGLAILSEIFTRFVQNTNTDVIVNGAYAGPEEVTWLNQGILSLSVTVSLPAQDFEVIRLVGINQLSLFFTVASSWAPPTSSSNTVAHFFLPFAFPVNIVNVGGPFIANYNGQQTAVLNIPTDSVATTDVESRVLSLVFNSVPFEVYDDAHPTFSQFLADTTIQQQVTFNLNGAAVGVADTAAGAITINGIPFSLDTNLLGLQGLNTRPAVTSNLNVVHGYPTYLLITANVALYNPSAITIGTGTVRFAVMFQDRPIGMAIINNLILVPGTNIISTEIDYAPQGAANVAAGQVLLENYVQNVTSSAIVAGTDQTTNIPSLVQALAQIRLNTEIPPLFKMIVIEAALEVPTDIAQTGVASATVMIANPFTASINILDLSAQAIYFGPSQYGQIILGTINQNFESDPLVNPGMTTTTSRSIPINLNIDPKNLIHFILTAAANTGTSLGPFPPFLQDVLNLADTSTTISPVPYTTAPPCFSGQQFDILGAILQLLKGLETTIPINSTLKLDDYQTDLDFQQSPVPTMTDNTALYLVGPAAAPLIQAVVNNATIYFNQANATSLVNEGFAVSLQGFLKTDAPADAYISFPDDILVDWEGTQIAKISLPPICSAPGVGVPNLVTSGQLFITNFDAFVTFTKYILNNPNFTWRIHSPSVLVQAVGINFNDVILDKMITLDSFNGLPGIVITYFTIYGETSDSLLIRANAAIPSPSALGVELGTANFRIFYLGTNIGPIQATNLFLAPKPFNGQPQTTTTVAMTTGAIESQIGNTKGLATLGILFTQFLAGLNQTLQLTGVSVISPTSGGQPVSWLTDAFPALTTNAVLPGQIYQIIFSIVLSDLTATINNPVVPYVITGGNNQTIATFANPFEFSLTPLRTAPMITLTYQGVDTAQINLPDAPVVSAGTSRAPTDIEPLVLDFFNQPIDSLNDASFEAFLTQLANEPSATFGLKGMTSVLARTVVGDIQIGGSSGPTLGIPFNVTSSLAGINSFNHNFSTADVVVEGGTDPTYIRIPLQVTLDNPSMLTIITPGVSLPITYTGVSGATVPETYVGRAVIENLLLIPDTNMIGVIFEYMPDDPSNADAEDLLTKFLQPQTGTESTPYNPINIAINGAIANNGGPLSPYGELVPAFRELTAAGTLAGIGSRVAIQINVYITARTLATTFAGSPMVDAKIILQDVLAAPINLQHLVTNIYANPGNTPRTLYARLDHTFENGYAIPPNGGTAESEDIPEITLMPNGVGGAGLATLIASLPILADTTLDIDNTIEVLVGAYRVPSLIYNEVAVNTTYFACVTPDDATCVPLTGISDLLQLLLILLGLGGQIIDELVNLLT